MNYIVIKFKFRDKIITWFFTEATWMQYMAYSGITLTAVGILLYKLYKRQKRQKQMPDVRGGLNIEEYIDPEFMDEVEDQKLATIIREFVQKYLGPIIRKNAPLLIDSKLAIVISYTAKEFILHQKSAFIVEKLNIKYIGPIIQLLDEANYSGLVAFGPTMELARFTVITVLSFVAGGLGLGGVYFLMPVLLNVLSIQVGFPGGLNLVLAVAIAASAVGSGTTLKTLEAWLDSLDQQAYRQIFRPIDSELVHTVSNDFTKQVNQFVIPEEKSTSTNVYIRAEDGVKYPISCDVVETEIVIETKNDKLSTVCEEKNNGRVCETKLKRKFVPLSERTTTWSQLTEQNNKPELNKLAEEVESEGLFDSYEEKIKEREVTCSEFVDYSQPLNPSKDLQNWDVEKWLDELNDWE